MTQEKLPHRKELCLQSEQSRLIALFCANRNKKDNYCNIGNR